MVVKLDLLINIEKLDSASQNPVIYQEFRTYKEELA
jgi:hypothetical protein